VLFEWVLLEKEMKKQLLWLGFLSIYFKDPSHPALGNPEAKEIKMLILSKILLFTQAKSRLCSPLT